MPLHDSKSKRHVKNFLSRDYVESAPRGLSQQLGKLWSYSGAKIPNKQNLRKMIDVSLEQHHSTQDHRLE